MIPEKAANLVQNLTGRMGPSPYDIAWMARVPMDGGHSARWPDLLDWLLRHQRLDGSWGGGIQYYHDRIICTLTAIIALMEYGEGPATYQAIKRGERYIWLNLHRLHQDPCELVGFELILPTLLVEAVKLGLDVPQHTCGYGRIRQEKLDLIPAELFYSPQVTTKHSLEFMGEEGNPERMQQVMATNGSLGNSPATTCYYLLQGGSDRTSALAYLENMLAHNEHVIYLYPCRIFELSWVLHTLALGCESLANLVDTSVWEDLRHNLSDKGIGLDSTFGIEDGDITSVTTRLLTLAGYPVSPDVLARFEDKNEHIFRTYEYERNVSIGTNIHALEAISLLPEYPNKDSCRDSIITFLLTRRIFDTYWVDKWHASPFYATTHVVVGLSRAAPEVLDECQRTIDWIAHTQRNDGSWGFYDQGTVEETAYALMTLLHCRQRFPIASDMLRRGAAYLYAKAVLEREKRYPPLWIGKALYVPYDVVRATVLAALILYEDIFGTPNT